ncbi:pyrimidine dimer DNA glycosylase/endonuclease V [Cellulomonas shaoxiangyii]|uniref:Pyrimidine dimer DNA glycosylase n=1 Tax=Cellulomonas shaoxiangyii TaxID=2566013 RepID=A0A4P7SG88_9CELL|nr:pyrimidine dimer DNA glycosylase/endonuclease V [Cellulomonas shaoxiangyii]QCB92641.1 pyrimidine dimer DNA glycosylase [Cellulomonas shaoxiangyii]TGY85449.1 pyrimidine dimer DNA glycosylase [Cellulomonas shaoxiangyii]
MRLWSLHPALLDRQGLTACWREALLAQAVLLGRTRGYTRHPQLDRFRAQPEPAVAVAAYLHGLRDEATRRGYRYDAARVHLPDDARTRGTARLPVTSGQLELEWRHLLTKLAGRSPDRHRWVAAVGRPSPHPLFVVVPGDVEPWERAS